MKQTRIFGCSKFRRLVSDSYDRALTEKEEAFMSLHREVCTSCIAIEQQSDNSLDMLRGVALDAQPTDHFDTRVKRRMQVERGRENLKYWTPALIGGAIACLALLTALKMVNDATHKELGQPIGQAQRYKPTKTPQLVLPKAGDNPNRYEP